MTGGGIAGRTNYAQWDKVAKDLVQQVDEESKLEEAEEKAKLGLDGKYAVSADDAAERAKAEQAKATKEKLEAFQKQENAKILEWKTPNAKITRTDVPVDQRVLRLCDMGETGNTIVLSDDLNQLEHCQRSNLHAKSFPDDAENEQNFIPETKTYGLIKVLVDNIQNAEILVQSKLITGTIELHQCQNVTLKLQHDSISTLQMDLCDDCDVCFDQNRWNPHNRILHAGCRNLRISHANQKLTADYITDGAKAIGNADATEYQFMSYKYNGEFITEPVVTTSGVPMTQRQVDEATSNRQKVIDAAVGMAEKMVQLTDAQGNPLVTKDSSPIAAAPTVTDVPAEVETLKLQGNEAFGMGEYAQAILQYSLAIDKTAALDEYNNLDILYSNRSAAFLKLGQHEKALLDADTALSHNPDNLKAAFRKGLALHASGQYEAALPVLAQAHQKEPKNAQIKQALQFCEVRLQQELRKRMQQ